MLTYLNKKENGTDFYMHIFCVEMIEHTYLLVTHKNKYVQEAMQHASNDVFKTRKVPKMASHVSKEEP